MKATKLGIYLLIGSLLSLIITMPLGVGYISGVFFVIAMLFTWGAAIWMTVARIFGRKQRDR